MGFINPIFSNREILNKNKMIKPSKSEPNVKKRKKRSDSTHNIKIPVSTVIQMKLKSYCREAKRIRLARGQETITQSKFNTTLLRYGLNNLELIKWNHDYKDTKVYMHTYPFLHEYEIISGPHGLAVQKNQSERKITYQIVLSVLNLIDKGVISLEEII